MCYKATMPFFFTALVASILAFAQTSNEHTVEKITATCSQETTNISIEQRNEKPPTLFYPDWENGKNGIEAYAEWNFIQGHKDIQAHCYKEIDDKYVKTESLPLSPETTKCILFRNKFTCYTTQKQTPSPTTPK